MWTSNAKDEFNANMSIEWQAGRVQQIYSAAQIYPNQNIRVIRVSPIRVYAYAYTHIRVYSVCAYASLVCMS